MEYKLSGLYQDGIYVIWTVESVAYVIMTVSMEHKSSGM